MGLAVVVDICLGFNRKESVRIYLIDLFVFFLCVNNFSDDVSKTS